ncbi:hypothetical protein V9T40_011384 [Parthenolecanium corni]|uniref:RNA-directed DNA polymerase n=1 Tax=Parthenolecanium corni TaxID=536013 RepID=A0AAN9T5D6_9HEMI
MPEHHPPPPPQYIIEESDDEVVGRNISKEILKTKFDDKFNAFVNATVEKTNASCLESNNPAPPSPSLSSVSEAGSYSDSDSEDLNTEFNDTENDDVLVEFAEGFEKKRKAEINEKETTVKRLKMISSQEASSEDTHDFEPQVSSTQNPSDANNGISPDQEQNIVPEEPVREIVQHDNEVQDQNIVPVEPAHEIAQYDNEVDPGDRTLNLTPEIVSEMPGFDDVLESFHSVSTTCPKFQNKTEHFTFKIKEITNPSETIQKEIGKVLEFGKRKARAHHKVGVTLWNNNDDQKPIYISFRRADQIDAEVLFQQIEAVIQSNETFLALGPHHLKLTTVEAIDGRGRIQNLDSGVDIVRLGGGIEALNLFQEFLKDHKITVYKDILGKNVVFEEKRNSSEKYIDLFYHNEHFELINSMMGFIGTSYYCQFCRMEYSNLSSHKCPNACKRYTYWKTDHHALTYFLKTAELTSQRVNRWRLYINNYDIKAIEHIPGKDNVAPDALSRYFEVINGPKDMTYPPLMFIVKEKVRHVEVINGIAYYINRDGQSRIYAPICVRADFIRFYHDRYSHPGVKKTLQVIRYHFDWPKCKDQVIDFCRSCMTCCKNKAINYSPVGQFKSIEAKEPLEMISVDIFGPVTKTNKGNTKLIVIMDVFTKFTYPVAKSAMNNCCDAINQSMSEYGKVKIILTIGALTFTSPKWKQYWYEKGVRIRLTSVYTPQSNPVETRMKVIGDCLRIYCPSEHHKWDEHLLKIEHRLNETEHIVTGTAPVTLFLKKKDQRIAASTHLAGQREDNVGETDEVEDGETSDAVGFSREEKVKDKYEKEDKSKRYQILEKSSKTDNCQRKGKQQIAFDLLKRQIAEQLLQVHPDWTKPFYIATDASNYAVARMVMQLRDNGEQDVVAIEHIPGKENVAPDALSRYFKVMNGPKDMTYPPVMFIEDNGQGGNTLETIMQNMSDLKKLCLEVGKAVKDKL